MLKELKKKSLKSNLMIILFLGVLGGVMIGLNFGGILALLGGKGNLDEMNVDQIRPGKYVEGTVYGIYDYYAYTEETKNGVSQGIVSGEYVIPVGEGEYMGMWIPKKLLDRSEALMQETWDYLDGKSESIYGQFQVKGTICKMEGESYSYYMKYLREYADYDTLTAEQQAAFLPYFLNVNHIGKSSNETFIFMTLLGLAFLTVALVILIKCLNGSYQKEIRRYCEAGDMGTMERLEQFYKSVAPVGNLRINQELLLGDSSGRTLLIPAADLLWAYTHVTTHKRNFVTVGKTYAIMLGTKDGKIQSHSVKGEEEAKQVMERLHAILPYVALGYSNELNQLFKKSRGEFIRQVEERKAQQSVE